MAQFQYIHIFLLELVGQFTIFVFLIWIYHILYYIYFKGPLTWAPIPIRNEWEFLFFCFVGIACVFVWTFYYDILMDKNAKFLLSKFDQQIENEFFNENFLVK